MLPERLLKLTRLLARLPGVGEKTAQRFALHLAQADDLAARTGEALLAVAETVRVCERCGALAELDDTGHAICALCRDPRRDGKILCVVARLQDLLALERSGAVRGRYFVLGKLLSPLDGIGADELPLERLHARIAEDGVEEVILATPPSVDGEATALLLARELAAAGLRVSRIASGVPHGGDLEFADPITLGRALEGRRSVSG